MKRLVLGILAHVDSGKTTLSEAMLYRAGELRRLGRVDHGDAFLDTDALERERGITIFSKQALLRLRGIELTLLDTPGHVDFSAEAERTLQVLDAAILVVSGAGGVQSHTETLWKLLERYGVPTFVFVNKMDQPGTDAGALLAELKKRLGEHCVAFGGLAAGAPVPPETAEELALCDDGLLGLYPSASGRPLEADGPFAAAVRTAIAGRRVFPCLFGSALRCEGIEELLCALESFLPEPVYTKDFSARVYKITQDAQGRRLTHLKVTGGELHVRDELHGADADGPWAEKVAQLRIYSGEKYSTVEIAPAGTVCAAAGLSRTRPGDGFGGLPEAAAPLLRPVMTWRVLPDTADAHTALGVLRRLEQQDPELHVLWDEALGEIRVQLMGEVQLEVLGRLLAERWGLAVHFDAGSILYLETIAGPVEGIGHYEPLRHYAEVHLLLEPGEPGSGVQFFSACREDDLDGSWQRLILSQLREKTHRGVLTGAPVTDLKVTLLAGRAHEKHTEGGDFREAAWRALRQGLRSAHSVLLEPWYSFRLEVPAQNLGRALNDLTQRGARTAPPELQPERAVLCGSAPVASLQSYSAEVLSYTRGQGRLTCEPDGYRPCRNAEAVIAAARYNADADLANPCDSVFCAHGAGFNVKWNEVRRYMHVDTGWGRRAPQPLAAAPARTAAARYRGTLEEDRELLAIFERTYGPIRRRDNAFRPTAETLRAEAAAAPVPDVPAAEDYLLVDGYNIIFAWEDLSALAAEDLEAARRRLQDILCNYRGWHGGQLILVFDAYRVRGSAGELEDYHGIHVVYTKEAETADMYIEKATHALAGRRRVRVATSDGLEQLIILGHGALRVSAQAFRLEVDAAETAIRECLS